MTGQRTGRVGRIVAAVLALAVAAGGLGSCALLRSTTNVWFPPDVFVPAPSDSESALVVVPIYFRSTYESQRIVTGFRVVQSGYSFRVVETTEEIGREYRTGWRIELVGGWGSMDGHAGWRQSRAALIGPDSDAALTVRVEHRGATGWCGSPSREYRIRFDRPAGGVLSIYPNAVVVLVSGSGCPSLDITERPLTAREAERIERDLARNQGYDLWQRAELTGVAVDYPTSRP